MYDSEDEPESAAIHPANDVDIFSFIDAGKIPMTHLDRPHVLTPVPGGEESYAALRDALDRDGQVGIVSVTFRSRRQLAILSPHGASLALRVLRWVDAATSLMDNADWWLPDEDDPASLTMNATGSWGPGHYYGAAHFNLASAPLAPDAEEHGEEVVEGIELAAPAAPPGCPTRRTARPHPKPAHHRQAKRTDRPRSAARGRKLQA